MAYLFKKKVRGKMYWYIGENKKIKGMTRRVWQKYLGPADKIADRLTYGVLPKEIDVLELGLCGALLHINKDICFVDIINKVISKRTQGLSYGEHLLLTVINRIDSPKSRSKLGVWFDGTILKRIIPVKKSYLSSQNFWNHWDSINDEQIDKIQELLLQELVTKSDISELCFDPTNFTTYIQEHKNQKIMQFGRAKNKRKGFRQVNLSLLVTKKDGMPLWHRTYEGNINDVTEFKEFISTIIKRVSIFSKKCKKITLVFDKGNNSKANIKRVNKKLHFFIVGSLKPSMFPDLFDIPLEEFIEEYITAKDKKVFCTSRVMNIYDGKKKVVVTYSNELAYKNRIRVEKALNKALNQLKNFQGKLKNTKLTRDELLIKVEKIVGKQYIKGLIKYSIGKNDGLSLKFEQDKKAYEELSKRFGKNILFTDNLTLETTEVVKIYNSKSIVEEQIKNLKDTHVISFTPIWCWTDKMIKVHAFTCVMALLFLRLLVKQVDDAGIELSQSQLIEHLKKIKLTLLKMPKSGRIHSKITRLNDDQRKLVNLLKIKKYT